MWYIKYESVCWVFYLVVIMLLGWGLDISVSFNLSTSAGIVMQWWAAEAQTLNVVAIMA